MEKKKKKTYESTKTYSLYYNKENINVQVNREIIERFKLSLSNISLKSALEELIKKELDGKIDNI